jgi:hypothetical protein
MSSEQNIVSLINNELALELPETISFNELQLQLSAYINQLINHDFEKLIYYLYRIDIHEGKLKQLLQDHEGENAAAIIAQLIIDRQLQKIKSRAEFKSLAETESDEEKW